MTLKIVVITIIMSLFAINLNADCIIKLRVREAPPAYLKDNNGEWTGFVVEQAKAIVNAVGCKIMYIDMPWKRALFSLEEGSLDMLGNMSITDERKLYSNFIGPHRFEKMRLIVNKDSNYQIQKHEDLKNIPGKISLIRGLWYGEEIKQLLKDHSFSDKVHWVSGSKLAVQEIERLRLGRVKAVVYPEFFLKDLSGIKYHSFIINSNPVYFGISKKSIAKPFLKKIEKAAIDLANSGEFEKIENLFH